MTLITWDKTMSVGVDELDEQHKKLITLINEAYAAIQQNDQRIMTQLLDKMRQYAKLHFATEEAYMTKYDFPNLQKHKVLHAKFNMDVDDFQKKQFEKTNFSQIFTYLSRWLIGHIMDEDKQYAPYLSKGDSTQT